MMRMESSRPSPPRTRLSQAADPLRRRVLVATFVIVAIAVLAGAVSRSPIPTRFGSTAGYAALVGVSVAAIAYARGGYGRAVGAAIAWVMATAYLAGSMVIALFDTQRDLTRAVGVAGVFTWAPLILVVMWLGMAPRPGPRLAVISYAVLMLPGLVFIGAMLAGQQDGSPRTVEILVRGYATNFLFLMLLSVFGRLNERYVRNTVVAETMQYLALTDTLTGLPNRRALTRQIERELARARRYNRPLVIALLDVDHFKAINDTHGHDVGDRVLREIGRTAREELRDTDVLGRWGGEEFLLIAPETTMPHGRALAERVRARLSEARILDRLRVTVSIGVAAVHGDEGLKDVVRRADDALYQAKAHGRDQVATA
jgi:diguanylate cyclase (GGDEF)-like protein